MQKQTEDKGKFQAEFEDVYHELTTIKEEHKQRLEERKKREEIQAIMKKK